MNFPHSVVRHVLTLVALIFRSVADVPKRFANYRDDRRLDPAWDPLRKDPRYQALIDKYAPKT